MSGPRTSSPATEVRTDDPAGELLGAVAPLIDRIGARLVGPAELDARDVPLHWRGAIVAGVRLADPGPVGADPGDGGSAGGDEVDAGGLAGILSGVERQFDAGGLAGILSEVERQFVGSLADLPRPDKQRAVRLLEEAGAFSYRKAVETVAGALGVSRFTVYNYLNRERD